jgi:hypothetical protein
MQSMCCHTQAYLVRDSWQDASDTLNPVEQDELLSKGCSLAYLRGDSTKWMVAQTIELRQDESILSHGSADWLCCKKSWRKAMGVKPSLSVQLRLPLQTAQR